MDAAARPPIQPARSLTATEQMRAAYWSGFCDYLGQAPALVKAFDVPASFQPWTESWLHIGIGVNGCHLEALIGVARGWIGLKVWCDTAEPYAALYERLDEFRELALKLGADLSADDVEVAFHGKRRKANRCLVFKRAVDWNAADRTELHAWHATGLLRLRELILGILS